MGEEPLIYRPSDVREMGFVFWVILGISGVALLIFLNRLNLITVVKKSCLFSETFEKVERGLAK
jgi:hypothetical protein